MAKRFLLLPAGLALGALTGCVGVRVAPPPPGLAADTPVAAPIAITATETNGPQMNTLGGEIPKSAPVSDIGEDTLGEAAPDEG